jgi:hypothetical protein
MPFFSHVSGEQATIGMAPLMRALARVSPKANVIARAKGDAEDERRQGGSGSAPTASPMTKAEGTTTKRA